MRPNQKYRYRSQRGFTLIELMVTISILAILVSIGYPTYVDQVRKSRRAEAMISLTEMANLQEQFFADNFRYTATVAMLPYMGTSGIGTGYYALTVPAVGTNPPTFTVQAQALGAKDQTNDANCRSFTLTNSGIRASKNSSNAASTGCWVTGE